MMETETPRPKRRWPSRLLLVAVAVLIAALSGGGGYYLGTRAAMRAGGDGAGQRADAPKSGLLKGLGKLGDGVASLGNAASSLTPRPTLPQVGAGGMSGDFEQQFKMLDRNGDGKLSPQEVPNPQFFKHMDTNGDGVVSKDEAKVAFAQLQAMQRAELRMSDEERFKQLDRDGDGKLSPKELPVPEVFKRLDANGDGAVTLTEIKALQQPPSQHVNAQGTGSDAASQRPPAQPPSSLDQYKVLDKDGDGKLSAAEFPNAALFKLLDTNGDGYVTREEGEAFMHQQQPPKAPAEQPKQAAPTPPTEQPAPPAPTEGTTPAPPAQPDAPAATVGEDKATQ